MSRSSRRRLVGWALALGAVYLAHAFFASRLAGQDAIGEVLLGRAGSVLPLAGLVLVLRLALIVVLPALAARAVARVVLDELASK